VANPFAGTVPASYSPGANTEFGLGVNHVTNTGRANAGSITLGGPLQVGSGTQGSTPHGVLATALGASQTARTGQDDASLEQYQRDSGGYVPGSMGRFQDQLTSGSDNTE
jgi:hypothetical protein